MQGYGQIPHRQFFSLLWKFQYKENTNFWVQISLFQHTINKTGLEIFMVTEFNKILSGWQPCWEVQVNQCFRDKFHYQGSNISWFTWTTWHGSQCIFLPVGEYVLRVLPRKPCYIYQIINAANFFPKTQQHLVGQDLLIIEALLLVQEVLLHSNHLLQNQF